MLKKSSKYPCIQLKCTTMLIIHYSCYLSIIQKLQASMIDYPTGEYILINVNALFPPLALHPPPLHTRHDILKAPADLYYTLKGTEL